MTAPWLLTSWFPWLVHWRNPLPWRIIGYLGSQGTLATKQQGEQRLPVWISGEQGTWLILVESCGDIPVVMLHDIDVLKSKYKYTLCDYVTDYVLDMWRAKFVCVCMTSLFLLVAFGWYCSSFSFGWLDNINSCHTGFLKISNRNRSRIIATTPDPLTPQNNPVSLLCRAAI